MARELKMHLYKPDVMPGVPSDYRALCGKVTENGTTDPEQISCNTCSGIYRTNVEWYSQVKNKAVEAVGPTGSGDLYTRQDVEMGLIRLGMTAPAIKVILDKTSLFRNVFLEEERNPEVDPWRMIPV